MSSDRTNFFALSVETLPTALFIINDDGRVFCCAFVANCNVMKCAGFEAKRLLTIWLRFSEQGSN
jgi:hypothetical protein